ncbi:MAG: HAD-IA family hydrolase [Paludibacteraceae bacterium]|nr:HAD-IA family hydrolase [Paludibacteraceae bacterium]
MRAYFFDMDGVLFDSMPNHARAWEQVMRHHGLHFSVRDCYVNEGRTGQDVIREALEENGRTNITEEEIWDIYREKSEAFHRLGGAAPMRGMHEVLAEIASGGPQMQIWIVTGSGQRTLFDSLQRVYPGVFARERMITAYDVMHGKPDPEPYLKAWERSGLPKEQCVVIENAPLGVRAGKAAGLFTIAVNTGVLTRRDLWQAGADIVLDDMDQLLHFIQLHRYVGQHVLPFYDTFDRGHNRQHALTVIRESLCLCREQALVGRLPLRDEPEALLCYAAAAFHDLGLRIDREHHHLHSGAFIRQDRQLPRWFTPEQIELIACAAEDHRAGRSEPPRSLYGCIVAEADRDIEPMTILRRTVRFGLKHYPELTEEQHVRRAVDHMHEKYAEGGYMRLWMHSGRNEQGLAALRAIIANPPQLEQILRTLYREETALR